MSIFENCAADPDRAWHELYRWACFCHPDQGGDPADFAALCAQARAVLPDWPLPDQPTLFQLFCRATGCRLAVGDPAAAPPAPWVVDLPCASVSPVGAVRLWPRATAPRTAAAGPPSPRARPPR